MRSLTSAGVNHFASSTPSRRGRAHRRRCADVMIGTPTYRITASESESRVRADALAAEQSVEMPVGAIADKRIVDEVVATVESIRPQAGQFEVVLGIAPATTGNEASQLVNMLFGNCSLQPEVELIDVQLPEGYEKRFRDRASASTASASSWRAHTGAPCTG